MQQQLWSAGHILFPSIQEFLVFLSLPPNESRDAKIAVDGNLLGFDAGTAVLRWTEKQLDLDT